jgi:hypothetical protein
MHAPVTLVPARQDPAPAADPAPAEPSLHVWGAHGGAGATTLAVLLAPARDMGTLRSEADYRYPPPDPAGNPVLIACRCTTWSALKAQAAVTALTKAGGQVKVLAVVSDGWPEPPIATAWFRLLSAQVGAIIRIPFLPRLRLCNDPALVPLPRTARHAVTMIRSLTGGGGCDDAAARGTDRA